jgi:signal transduction histidine kinase
VSPRGTSARSRAHRLGLRSRLTAAFAVGAALLSLLLAIVTYSLVRDNLVSQRESSATQQAYYRASGMRTGLRTAGIDPSDLLQSLSAPSEASTFVVVGGAPYSNDVGIGLNEIPEALRAAVAEGRPARMRYVLDGTTRVAIGIPLPAVDASFFESASFAEVESALNSLTLALVVAGTFTTIAGASLGAAAGRSVLRPLAEVRQAAVAIAGGRLDTRVTTVDDADLGALVTSFNDMARALQERIERDARFASDVSHELRSPLTTLSASIEVLQARRDDLPERAQFALDLLVADVQRFNTMVEDLLEISRFDAGNASLQLDTVRISQLVQLAVRRSGVPVEVQPAARGCTVQVDKRRLMRVLANLIDNAAAYAGGATLVSVELADANVRIAVSDGGPGVDPGDRDRIFERFSRGGAVAGQRGTSEGVGLGLALVKEHVALHGGRVWVEDGPEGVGARFVVELPLVFPTAEEVEEVDLGPAAVPAAEVEPRAEPPRPEQARVDQPQPEAEPVEHQ